MAGTTFFRSWQDFEWVTIVTLPMFLFSASSTRCRRTRTYLQPIVAATPLYQGVALDSRPYDRCRVRGTAVARALPDRAGRRRPRHRLAPAGAPAAEVNSREAARPDLLPEEIAASERTLVLVKPDGVRPRADRRGHVTAGAQGPAHRRDGDAHARTRYRRAALRRARRQGVLRAAGGVHHERATWSPSSWRVRARSRPRAR